MSMESIRRRDFLKQTSIFTAGLLAMQMDVLAGTFEADKLADGTILGNKKIDPDWIKSLYQRGVVTTYLKSKNELKYIGMPVGGINCGTVYLGGDGRLWLWDIFNKNQEGIEPKLVEWNKGNGEQIKLRPRDGAAYVFPATEIHPLEQGFAIKLTYKGNTITKRFHQEDWAEIKFEATYPLAVIHYIDSDFPLEIKLTAFSPFIPLDEDNSNIPVTIQSFEIKNTGKEVVEFEIMGWLENAVNKFSATAGSDGKRENMVINKNNHVSVFSTFNPYDKTKFTEAGDSGSLCLSFIGKNAVGISSFNLPFYSASFNSKEGREVKSTVNATEKIIAGIAVTEKLAPGKTVKKEFAISWHFPNVGKRINVPDARTGHYYLNKFPDALAVADYVADRYSFLSSRTKLWKNTWYNSTLPWWFMERTFSNISALATTTSHRFKTGRSWAWEGVGACEGNCTHVWHYAQATGRIFPGIERDNRQRVDLGIALQEDGGIWFRAEYDKRPAIDGQAGRVLGCLREHQMSADDAFLRTNWPNIKKATQFLIHQDKNGNGLTDTPMENTLDAVWDGEIAWIAGLSIAAVKAGGVMAVEMNDTSFAEQCKVYVEKGSKNMDEVLFNGEYYIHQPDAIKGREGVGSYNTCHIDQVLGQSWAWQVGLGRINDKEKTASALKALWKYNFMQDVGPYLKEHTGWRPYALPGESGMVMNTNPKKESNPYGESVTWQMGYFHECMTGFEHQVASHLMAEEMTDKAMILTRAVHDRYHAYKRNPFNEIECSDHYGRAMASYGTFITACGFEYHGPKGFIRFAPKWNKENFEAPFVTSKGWGSYSQKNQKGKQIHRFEVKYGSLRLQKINLQKISVLPIEKVIAAVGGQKVKLKYEQIGNDIIVELDKPLHIQTNETLIITI